MATTTSYQINNDSSTKQFFNNFYTKNYTISPNANDAIVSYFETFTGSKTAGAALAAAVVYTALSQEVDPMSVLDHFKTLKKGEINAYLALYLNLNRVGTSLVGVTQTPSTNKYVQRTILP